MRKPFFYWLLKTQPRGFQNFKFLNFSVYTTLLVPKQPISIKNFVHCGALQSRRASSDLFSFFYTPCSLLANWTIQHWCFQTQQTYAYRGI